MRGGDAGGGRGGEGSGFGGLEIIEECAQVRLRFTNARRTEVSDRFSFVASTRLLRSQ